MGGASPERLVVGTLGKAVGLKGEIEVRVISDDPARFAQGALVELTDRRSLTVRSLRPQGQRQVVAFEEITERTSAEALRGETLYVAREAARQLPSDEFWDFDLVGCTAVTPDDAEIGVVSDVVHGGGGELLVIRGGDEERLVPLVRAIVVSVDVAARRIVIDPPPGLLD